MVVRFRPRILAAFAQGFLDQQSFHLTDDSFKVHPGHGYVDLRTRGFHGEPRIRKLNVSQIEPGAISC
jgi:hypothetical protein